ncbi:MAG: hypothetical protein RMK91_05090 [Pseudanabaenaceae cyanobacterium SKYGB_i_bin29]|nr:hypothetical protein [Pseudanabaenaceae cyanobacterium SKYG29]MDW8421222.1 hypothetical protein [Pseudanabaenaceae cyanobacterium SKYGB_i_bin29]
MKALQQLIRYIEDAIMRIFGPAKDNYPKTGEQPFSGETDRVA